jgi:hypothetical protein
MLSEPGRRIAARGPAGARYSWASPAITDISNSKLVILGTLKLYQMNRRSFLIGVGGIGMISASAARPKAKYFRLDQFFPRHSEQLGALHDVLRHSGRLPKPLLVLQALVAPYLPQVAALRRVDSIRAFLNDRQEPLCEPCSTSLLETAPDSPDPPIPPNRSPIFELRVYHSPDRRQLAEFHERLVGPEINIFQRSGVHPILYTSALIGPNRPNLAYLIPFDSLAARERAWNAFAADEEWIKIRRESIYGRGWNPGPVQIAIYKAADFC